MRTPEEIRGALRRTCPLGEFVLDDNEAAIVMETAIREARAAALEEAAEIAGRDVDWTAFGKADLPQWDGGPDGVRDYRIGINAGRNIAAAIRALQEPPCPSPAAEEKTG